MGLTKLDEYVLKNTSVSLFCNKADAARMIELVEMRNLMVHNRGIVNRIFKSRIPGSNAALGTRIKMSISEMMGNYAAALEWIMDLDKRLCQEFKLPTQPRVARPTIPELDPIPMAARD